MRFLSVLLFGVFTLLQALCCSAAEPATPKRIVSLAPSFTEILFALGMNQEIVGTTSYCDYPAEALKTTKIGDMMNPNVEKIVSLKPDVVFAGNWKWEVPEKLRKVGIHVVEIDDAVTLKDSLERIRTFGAEVGRTAEAEKIIASMQKRLDVLKSHGQRLQPHPRIFIELDAGQWTVGGKSYLNEVFQVLGLVNTFGERVEPYLMVTMESIVSRDPDLLISLCRTSKEYSESTQWSTLRAVKEKKIIDQKAIEWNAITHQGPRLVDGMEALEKQVNELMLEKQ